MHIAEECALIDVGIFVVRDFENSVSDEYRE